jgi:hypothetical protein
MGCSPCKEVGLKLSQLKDFSPPNEKSSKIGKFLYLPNETEKRTRIRWESVWNKHRSIFKILENMKENKFHKGFPQPFRWEAWKVKMKVMVDPLEYQNLSRNSEFSYQICKDIDRTFPNHPYFDSALFGHHGQNALKRILEKFAFKNPKVGYCQGMNFLVGFFLLVSGGREAEVFAFLETIYKKFQLSEVFQEDMTGLKRHLWIFDKIFEQKLNKLYWHFREQDVLEDLWLLKWFLTMFTVSFPVNVVVFMWDLIVLEGFESVYKIALAVLKTSEEKLLKMNTYQVVEFFSGNFLSCGPQVLLKKARTFKLLQNQCNFERESKSLPCPVTRVEQLVEESQSEANSPKVTVQTVVEEPPLLISKNRGYHSTGHWQVINPFLVNSGENLEKNNFDDSFNAEDVLNNLVTENDWESL